MEFFIYLSKSAAILFLFYVVYIIVLRKDTFFTANRFYLLSGIIAALWLPALTFTQTIYVELPPALPQVYTQFSGETAIAATSIAETVAPVNWWYIATLLYGIGVAYMVSQFTIRLFTLLRLLRKHPSRKQNGFVFVQINENVAPFSFFNYIVYNPKYHQEEELQMILQHEKIHASQWHSIDVLAAHLLRALHWLNPISWWYKKSLEANLEFIADDQTAQQVTSKEAYQLALVKASSALQTPVLTTNFYQSFIKKRIIMLNKDHSNKYNQLKLSLIVPILGVFLWSFNTSEIIEYTEALSPEKVAAKANNLSFSAQSSNDHLDAIEQYFAANHPDMLVEIANRSRDAQGALTNFSLNAKFKEDQRFHKFFARTTNEPFVTEYQLIPEENNTIVVKESGKDGVTLRLKRGGLKIIDPTIMLPSTPLKSEKTTVVLNEGDMNLGENPLYIINSKPYLQNQLPEHSEIRLDGKIELFSKKEGFQKYGVKGKDGVLHFDGVSTFISNPPEENLEQNTKVDSKNYQNSNQDFKRIQFPITRNTTDAQLDQYAAEAKSKYGYEVSFTVERNSSREITSVRIAYEGRGNSGNISSSNGGPIADSFFYINNETGGAGFVNEGSEERMEEMRERMEVRRAEMEERRAERELEMEQRRGLLEEKGEERKALMEERREIMRERRERERDLMRAYKKENQSRIDSVKITGYSKRGLFSDEEEYEHEEEDENYERAHHSNILAQGYAQVRQSTGSNLAHVHQEAHAIMLDKDTTDATLAIIKSNLKNQGVDFSYKRVKRNSRGEITSIKLTIDDNKGSKMTKFARGDNGEPIGEVLVKI